MAEETVLHPNFVSSDAAFAHEFDLAVLLFDEDLPAPPLVIGRPQLGQTLRAVGNGLVGTDLFGRPRYETQRRSATQTVTRIFEDGTIYARGEDGGLCWNDGGGPLLSEDGTTVYGVLSSVGVPGDCLPPEDERIFARLEDQRWFWEPYLTVTGRPGPTIYLPDYAGLIELDSDEARFIKVLVNTASAEKLEDEVGLDPIPTVAILTRRAGPDQLDGTDDDTPFLTLDELDALPSIERKEFRLLLDFVR